MLNVFTLIPLFFLLITSYLFNRNKLLEHSKGKIIVISIFEGILSYIIIFILTLKGSISIFGLYFLLIILLLLIGFILFLIQKELDNDWDLQIETIKNNIIIYATTILPLYVFLTIFRFLDTYLQISLSIIVTAAIYLSSLYVKKWLAPFFNKIFTILHDFFSTLNFPKIIFIFVFVWVVVGAVLLFDLPTNAINEELNLSNHVGYFNFDEYPTNLQNDFQTKTDTQIISTHLVNSENNSKNRVTDYYFDQSNLYIYTTDGQIMVYDLNTKELIFNKDLNSVIRSGAPVRNEAYNKFIYYDNHLILLATNGIYLVTTNNVTKISDFSCYEAFEFYRNNELYFLGKNDLNIYKFENGTLTLIQNSDNKDYRVISENLFYTDNNKFILADNPTISFEILQGNTIYDSNKKIMYFTMNQDYSNSKDEMTIYQKEDKFGNISNIKVGKHHNPLGIIAGDNIYYTASPDDNNMRRVEIIDNNNFEISSISNFHALQSFWIGNSYDSYIANYRINNNQLEYLQIDQNNKQIVFTIHHLQQEDIDLNLPFYSYFGLGIFVIIILAYLIPTTNYREYITVIDFESATKNKE